MFQITTMQTEVNKLVAYSSIDEERAVELVSYFLKATLNLIMREYEKIHGFYQWI